MRSIGMVPFKGPSPGKGWGCFQCGLPSDGAVVVVCDDCVELEGDPVLACADYPKSPDRVEMSSLTIPFEHDLTKHPELSGDALADMADAAKGAEFMREELEGGGSLSVEIVDGVLFDGLPMLRLVVLFGELPIAEFAIPGPALPAGAAIGDELLIDLKIRTCRKCGCTGSRACVMGCEWIEADLCSNCGSVIFDASGRPAGGGAR